MKNETFIRHERLMDCSHQLSGYHHYIPYECRCRGCGAAFILTSRAQAYILEIKRVSVRTLQLGRATWCSKCRREGRVHATRNAYYAKNFPYAS